MEKFNITKNELIRLCVESDVEFETSTTYPDKCSSSVWEEITNVLNTKLSTACVKRNLVDVKEVFNMFGFNSIQDIKNQNECSEEEAVTFYKSFVVTETLNNAYFEQLNKKLVSKTFGKCYVPETLALGISVKWLATDENIKRLEESHQEKIKYDDRPVFTKTMMKVYICDNNEVIKAKLAELDALKNDNDKDEWQVKANALVQQVSNNDFRILNWKDIYKLIREKTKIGS